MTIANLTGPVDLATMRQTLNELIDQINVMTTTAPVITGELRSTYDAEGVLPASSATAGFAVTSNYAGFGEVDFWSLVNRSADAQGFYFYQKTAASTEDLIGSLYSDATTSYFDVSAPDGTFLTLSKTSAGNGNVSASGAVSLALRTAAVSRVHVGPAGGVTILAAAGAEPTGGNKGVGTLNVAGTIWADGTQGITGSAVTLGATLTVKNGLVTGFTGI